VQTSIAPVDLTSEQREIIEMARRRGFLEGQSSPAYLPPRQCTVLTFLLALPTLGFSLVLVPILWVVQYEHTSGRLRRLKEQLEADPYPSRLEVVLHL